VVLFPAAARGLSLIESIQVLVRPSILCKGYLEILGYFFGGLAVGAWSYGLAFFSNECIYTPAFPYTHKCTQGKLNHLHVTSL